jgi:hypothetical protein
MLAALFQTRENLKAELAETFSAEVAAAIAEAFLARVVRHRREIEAAGATPRMLN